MDDAAVTSQEVLSAAEEAGLDAAAVVPLDALAEASLDGWVAAGRHGEMRWLERHAGLRRDPRATFPGYQSALIALAEYGDAGPNPSDPRLGNVSRYALSDDYHETLKGRLRAVADALRERWPSLRTRALVDANPLNEKVLARLGGLGFIGKHTNLILEGRGSWFFLGVLLLSQRIDSRGPMAKNRCGTCERCLAACPTNAILEPYVLDARLCISYLTIELRGPIPRELRPAIGNRIFGCDDCQEVCPWNRFAHRGPTERFRPRDGLQGRSLGDWLAVDAPGFEDVFRGSAVLRTGHEGFIRNVLVAAGNSGDQGLVGPVAAKLSAASPTLRSSAAWALGRLGGEAAEAALQDAAAVEVDEAVRGELGAAMADFRKGPKPISGMSDFEKKKCHT